MTGSLTLYEWFSQFDDEQLFAVDCYPVTKRIYMRWIPTKALSCQIEPFCPEEPTHASAPFDHIRLVNPPERGYMNSCIHVMRDPNKTAMEYCGAVCFSLTNNKIPKSLTMQAGENNKVIADYGTYKLEGNTDGNGKMITNKVVLNAKKRLNFKEWFNGKKG